MTEPKTEPRKAMSPEAQRIAIAEACGWRFVHKPRTAYTSEEYRVFKCGKDLGGFDVCRGWNHCFQVFSIPDYLNDLNAMREAEMTLTPTQRRDWLALFYDNTLNNFEMATAPASKRAEIFLRTIGQWKAE